jgi:hypothetical protein
MRGIEKKSLAERIASMEFAVELLAEVMRVQGLASRAELSSTMRTAASVHTRAATVARTLSAISHLVNELEQRATKEELPPLRLVRRNPPDEADPVSACRHDRGKGQ